MYYDYFGLTEAPFSIAPNPEYLFMTERHQEALAHLYHSVESDAGFVLLTGDVGTGKTTVCRCFLEKLPEDTDAAFILNPFLSGKELLRVICQELNIKGVPDKATLRESTDAIYRHLLENHAKGKQTVLLIDEAQHLHFKVLELIRLLTNLETDRQKLLKIILIGQPELNVTLDKPELTQLSQRVTARYHIHPLSFPETIAYIDYRLRMAGYLSEKKLFPKAVVKKLFSVTQGIPRLLNVICDRALLGTYSKNRATVDRKILEKAIREVKGQHQLKQNKKIFWIAGAFASVVLGLIVVFQWLPFTQELSSGPIKNDIVDSQQVQPIQRQIDRTKVNRIETDKVFKQSLSTAVNNQTIREPADARLGNPETVSQSAIYEKDEAGFNFYRLQETALRELILSINKEAALQQQNCETIEKSGWQCRRNQTTNWQTIRQYNRPALLTLNDNGGKYYTGITGLTDTHAQIISPYGEKVVSLSKLEKLWTGEFIYLWQPPEGFKQYIYFDSDERLVDWLANAFALVDNRDDVLAEKEFNSLLKRRVILFQRENKLIEDGIAGVETLLRLNEKLGRAVTLSQGFSVSINGVSSGSVVN
ncbi:MAG: AAA family ATPase [Cellvibrionaceae bacterium]